MKGSSLLFCLVLSVVLLYGGVCPISAQAPGTAKIVFVSARDLNREIYLMNPDGSEQVNLTKNLAERSRSRKRKIRSGHHSEMKSFIHKRLMVTSNSLKLM